MYKILICDDVEHLHELIPRFLKEYFPKQHEKCIFAHCYGKDEVEEILEESLKENPNKDILYKKVKGYRDVAIKQEIEKGVFPYDVAILDINLGARGGKFGGVHIFNSLAQNFSPPNQVRVILKTFHDYDPGEIVESVRKGAIHWVWEGRSEAEEKISRCLDCRWEVPDEDEDIYEKGLKAKCKKCGAPLKRSIFGYYDSFRRAFELVDKDFIIRSQQRELKEKIAKIKEALSPPELYEVTIMQKDFSKGPILASISKKENPGTEITLELNPNIQGLVFLVLAEEVRRGRKFLSPRIIANRVNQLKEQEEPTILNEEEQIKFIKAEGHPPCNLDRQKARNCETYCDALKLPEACPFDYLFYPRYNLRRFTAENVRTHIKEIRNMVFLKVQEQVGDKKLTRCLYSGSDKFCSLSDPIRNICKICRNDFILHGPRGYGMAAKVKYDEE